MLTDVRIRNAKPRKKPYKLSDAGGLHLLIKPHGSKLWRVSYRYGGKQKTLASGVYPLIRLKAAREQRDEAKRLLARGVDPSAQRRLAKHVAATGNTFRAVAEEVFTKQQNEGRAVATLEKLRWLLEFAYPSLAERPIAEITAPELLTVLRKVEARGRYEIPSGTAPYVLRSTIGQAAKLTVKGSYFRQPPSTPRPSTRVPRIQFRVPIEGGQATPKPSAPPTRRGVGVCTGPDFENERNPEIRFPGDHLPAEQMSHGFLPPSPPAQKATALALAA
jgi:hypothetical protein